MPYRVPVFNLTVNVWRQGVPVTDPPDLVIQGNLTPQRRRFAQYWFSPDPLVAPTWSIYLLVPKLTDLRDQYHTGGGDSVEIPAGSQRFYTIVFVEDVAKGFPNEYRFAVLAETPPWPAPMP